VGEDVQRVHLNCIDKTTLEVGPAAYRPTATEVASQQYRKLSLRAAEYTILEPNYTKI
jgi:hypothetical protein